MGKVRGKSKYFDLVIDSFPNYVFFIRRFVLHYLMLMLLIALILTLTLSQHSSLSPITFNHHTFSFFSSIFFLFSSFFFPCIFLSLSSFFPFFSYSSSFLPFYSFFISTFLPFYLFPFFPFPLFLLSELSGLSAMLL